MPKRRQPTAEQLKNPSYEAIVEWSRFLADQVGKALAHDRDQVGGILQLEQAIAAVAGGFPVVERRKLHALIEASDRDHLSLTWREMAALDAFWAKDGGLVKRLRSKTLARALSEVDALAVFLPEFASPEDPDGPGNVSAGDSRGAEIVREVLRELNPALRFERHVVPWEIERLRKVIPGQPDPNPLDLLPAASSPGGGTMAVVSIGSGRTNHLSRALLAEFGLGDIEFGAKGSERFLVVKGKRMPDHALIAYRLRRSKRIDVVLAGDHALSTVAAAREISRCRSASPADGAVTWALVKVTLDEKRSDVVSSRIEHYESRQAAPAR